MPISTAEFKSKIIGKIKEKLQVKEIPANHIRFKLYHKDKKILETYCSHGSGGKEIYDAILSKIKRQLRLNNTNQLYDLKNCPMTAEDYFNLLREKNVISD